MWTRSELKERGKLAFKANYWKCVLVSIVMGVAAGAGAGSGSSASNDLSELNEGANPFLSMDPAVIVGMIVAFLAIFTFAFVISTLITVFAKNPLSVGCNSFFLNNSYQPATLGHLGSGFNSGTYMNVVMVMFMRQLFTVLFTFLLIIPGIIKGYEYRMVPYILAENPSMKWKEALELSKQMMYGEKWNAFVLDLSFLGWHILSIFTCGILSIFYVNPYVYATDAELYKVLKSKQYAPNNYGY